MMRPPTDRARGVEQMNGKNWTSLLAHGLAIVCFGFLILSLWLPVDAAAGDTSGGPWEDPSEYALLFLLVTTVFVGWFLAWRRPRLALGWLVLAIPVLFLGTIPLILLGHALIPTHPNAGAWLLLLGGGNGESNMTWVPPIGILLAQIPLRFPTGSLPSKRWRWFFWYTVAAIAIATALGSTDASQVGYGVANPVHIAWGDAAPILYVVVFGLCLMPAIVGSLASLAVRYRRAGPIERAQLRWVLWAAAVAIGGLVLSWILGFLVLGDDWYVAFDGIASIVVLLGYGLVPVAILVAVMRFGLYGIDRVISRTVSYAIVVITVVALYSGVVTGLAAVIPNLPSVGVALATLTAAAVFLPLLRWVQRRIDKRFNRTAYDAQQLVEAFGQRLRNGADPHTAAQDLATVANAALQPTALGVWTR